MRRCSIAISVPKVASGISFEQPEIGLNFVLGGLQLPPKRQERVPVASMVQISICGYGVSRELNRERCHRQSCFPLIPERRAGCHRWNRRSHLSFLCLWSKEYGVARRDLDLSSYEVKEDDRLRREGTNQIEFECVKRSQVERLSHVLFCCSRARSIEATSRHLDLSSNNEVKEDDTPGDEGKNQFGWWRRSKFDRPSHVPFSLSRAKGMKAPRRDLDLSSNDEVIEHGRMGSEGI